MSEKKEYKVGDTFSATVRINEIDDCPEERMFKLCVVEMEGVDEEGSILNHDFYEKELKEAFDLEYKERKRLKRIEELEAELKELKNGTK